MANTKIQIKRSSANATPTNGSLSAGELAYSYNSEILYLGTANGANVQAIGGTYYLGLINSAFAKANAASATGMDYPFVNTAANSANSYAVTVGAASNAWANSISYTIANGAIAFSAANGAYINGNNAANSANAYAVTVGAASNNYANATFYTIANGAIAFSAANGAYINGNNAANSANAYTVTVGAASNTWANTLSTADRAVANAAANSANAYTVTVGTAGNNYTNQVGAASNGWANAVGTAGNNWVNATFVKLTASQQTITGDLSITGNLTLLGNATSIRANNLVIGDSLIYLAANNYSGTDIVDIGFVANYGNATAANVHTGLIRDATTKQYYLFQGLDIELDANNTAFVPYANGAVNAALNADLITSNLNLGGANAITWINSLYPYANGVANSSNAYAVTVGTAGNNYAIQVGAASNTWANSVGTAGNNYTNAVGVAGNNYTNAVGTAGNNYTNAVGVAGNNYMLSIATGINSNTVNNAVGANGWANTLSTSDRAIANAAANSANAYTVTVGAASNTWANTIAQNWANTRLSNVIATAGRTTVTWSTTGGYTNATIDLATTTVAAATYGGTDQIPSFTVDSYGRLTFAGNNGINVGAATAGTLPVARGGTGNTTFTANSILVGNGTSPVWGLQSSTEGHVLQVSAAGAPQFAMLDGGSF